MPILDQNNINEKKRYDAFVKSSPYTNATQDLAWTKVKMDWKNEAVYLEENGEIIAAITILFKKFVGNTTMAYAPRGPVCDIENTDLVMKLLKEAEPALKKHHAFMLRIDPEVLYTEELEKKYIALGFKARNKGLNQMQLIQPRHNMFLYLNGQTFDEIMPTFSEKTRYNIRYSARKGVETAYYHTEEALKTFYDIYKVTCARDQIGRRPYEYFKAMFDAYSEDELRVYISSFEGEPLSAAIALNYGKKMWYIYGASSNEKRNLMPNYSMQKAMIDWAIETKKEIYDFGGVYVFDKTDGLYKFKEGFCRRDGGTELIGELDLVYNKFLYNLFSEVAPAVRKLLKKISLAKSE